MRFRPCIDLHDGKVKQIVGSSLKDNGEVVTNFVSEQTPAYYAERYYADGLEGGHVILLGPGNERAAEEAVSLHPGNLQLGGGVNPENARRWLDIGASKVIVTSWLFLDNELNMARVREMSRCVGRERLVIDLSCIQADDGRYHVACNRWQTVCKMTVDEENLKRLAEFCDEFLVHAVGVEGKCGGIDAALVRLLADGCPVPVTYAGGIRNLDDIRMLKEAGRGRVDFTVGSALDIFGGPLRYQDVVACRF